MSEPQSSGALAVEMAGLDVIPESDRKGKPSDLFMPWFAAKYLGPGYLVGLVGPRLRAFPRPGGRRVRRRSGPVLPGLRPHRDRR